jgi:hypothetical protein
MAVFHTGFSSREGALLRHREFAGQILQGPPAALLVHRSMRLYSAHSIDLGAGWNKSRNRHNF